MHGEPDSRRTNSWALEDYVVWAPALIGGYVGYRRGQTVRSTAVGAAIGLGLSLLPTLLLLTVGLPGVNDPITLALQRGSGNR